MNDTPGRQASLPRTAFLRDEAIIAGRLLVLTAAVGVVIWMLLQVKIVTASAFFGFTLAALLWPIVKRVRRVMPHALAVLLTVAAFLTAVGMVMAFLINRILSALPNVAAAVVGGMEEGLQLAEEYGAAIPQELTAEFESRLGELVSSASSAAASGIGALGTLASVLLLTIMVLVFTLMGGERIAAMITDLFPRRNRQRARASMRSVVMTARAWLFAATATGVMSGSLIGIGMWGLGVPLALSIGMLTFFSGFIPTIGAILAGALAVMVALFSNSPITALWVLLIVLVVQQIQGNVVEPLLLSRAMQFPPLVTLLLTTAGGLAFGLIGLLLSVPLVGMTMSFIGAWRRNGHETTTQGSSRRLPSLPRRRVPAADNHDESAPDGHDREAGTQPPVSGEEQGGGTKNEANDGLNNSTGHPRSSGAPPARER